MEGLRAFQLSAEVAAAAAAVVLRVCFPWEVEEVVEVVEVEFRRMAWVGAVEEAVARLRQEPRLSTALVEVVEVG